MEVYRPVLVIFRDYAFAHGSSRGLGGHYFVDEGVVVVTVNYRLGALGMPAQARIIEKVN
jgi:carboxylesterase type B